MSNCVTIDEYLKLPVPEYRWLVEGLIPRQSFVVLWGPPKSGKTIFSLQTALAIGNRTPFLGHLTHQSSVLILELDTGHQMLRSTLHTLSGTQSLGGSVYLPHPDSLAAHHPLHLTNESSSLYVHSLISETQPGLVIVDCLSEIDDHDENEQKSVKPVIAALKHLTVFHPTHPCACLLIHHTVKFDYLNKQNPIPSPLKAGRGSGYLAGAADSVWFLHRVTSDSDPHGLLKVVPRFAQPQTFHLKQGAGGWWSHLSTL